MLCDKSIIRRGRGEKEQEDDGRRRGRGEKEQEDDGRRRGRGEKEQKDHGRRRGRGEKEQEDHDSNGDDNDKDPTSAESLTETSSDNRILDIVRKVKLQQNAIQAVGASFNPENKQYDITVVSRQPNEVRRQIEESLTTRSLRLPGYNLKIRNISEEGIDVTQSKEFIEFFQKEGYSKEIFKIQRIISRHSGTLLTQYPNVTSISFSPVKSRGYGTSNHVILEESCIVIFVEIKFDKNRIPLRSERIPEKIDGVKTDVREGFVETLMHQQQNSLSIENGAPITSKSKIGSSGPFVRSQHGRTGFLTSLHVLLSSEEIELVTSFPFCGNRFHNSVYKATGHDPPEIGKIEKVYFSTGDDNQQKSGYEIGLVKLAPNVDTKNDNLPTIGLANYNGETTVITEDNSEGRIRKLGAKTGLTQGIYAGQNWLRLAYNGTASFDLHCQIGLLSAHYEKDITGRFVLNDFAIPGDSGALVTIREGNTDKVVGIFTGWRTDGIYIATPIQQISDRLQSDGWKICAPTNNNNDNGQPMDIGQ